MEKWLERTALLLGEDGVDKLKNSTVAVFGLGGVGGNAFEVLVRSGVGRIHVYDDDCADDTNLNRQLLATRRTLGMKKTQTAIERAAEINPLCRVIAHNVFVLPENISDVPFSELDYIIDCIDTVTAKIALACEAKNRSVPIISCMGTGNKLDPTKLEIDDIYATSVCPLARVMRRELKKRGISELKVLYSEEKPIIPDAEYAEGGKHYPGSVAFVPSAAGIIIAAEVVKDICFGKI